MLSIHNGCYLCRAWLQTKQNKGLDLFTAVLDLLNTNSKQNTLTTYYSKNMNGTTRTM